MTTFPTSLWLATLLVLPLAAPQEKSPPVREDPSKAMVLSYQFQAEGDYAGAARALRPLIDAQPKAYFPRLRQAYLLLQCADYTNAAEAYLAASLIEPAAIEPLLGQHLALIPLESFDDAEKVGREILARDPKNYLGLSRHARVLYKRGNSSAAAEIYQKASRSIRATST